MKRLILGLVLCILCAWSTASGDMRGPGLLKQEQRQRPRSSTACAPGQVWARGAYWSYRTVMSPARGGRCPMHPSCSHFSEQAFRKRGPILGLLATADRLIRCGSDSEMYLRIITQRGIRRFDPVVK